MLTGEKADSQLYVDPNMVKGKFDVFLLVIAPSGPTPNCSLNGKLVHVVCMLYVHSKVIINFR